MYGCIGIHDAAAFKGALLLTVYQQVVDLRAADALAGQRQVVKPVHGDVDEEINGISCVLKGADGLPSGGLDIGFDSNRAVQCGGFRFVGHALLREGGTQGQGHYACQQTGEDSFHCFVLLMYFLFFSNSKKFFGR